MSNKVARSLLAYIQLSFTVVWKSKGIEIKTIYRDSEKFSHQQKGTPTCHVQRTNWSGRKLHKLNFCNFLVDIFFKCSYQVDTRIDKHQSIFSYCLFNCGISSEGATLSRWKQRGDKSKKPIAFIVCLHLFLACKISLICGIFFICIQNNILVKFQNLMFYLIYIYIYIW